MAAKGNHRIQGADLVFSFWLVFGRDGEVALLKKEPRLLPSQRAMQIEARLPTALWQIPQLSAEITVPDTGHPATIAARVDQFAEQLRTAVGCDVVLTMTTPEA